MCGRVKLPDDVLEIVDAFRIKRNMISDYAPQWNVPPTTPVPVITSEDGERRLEWMRWGLIPYWARDEKIGYSTFNARADTLDTKPAFRSAWRAGRRIAIVTSGFYEWRKSDKQPFCITLGNKQPMLMAGLYETWKPPQGDSVRTATIITTEPNPLIAELHDRMPVILDEDPESIAAWLGETPLPTPKVFLKSFPAERMTMWPVAKAIGNVKNEGRELAEPVTL
jgi:putative SOS response-associated peptidase YedK